MNLSLRRIRYRKQASSALIIVLFAVVLVTLMIVAIMVGAGFERQSAFYYEERIRADVLAQSGLDQAIGLLRTGMGSATNQWVSGPGLMVNTTYNTNNNTVSVGASTTLSSGTNTTTPTGVWQAANLNGQMLDGTYPLDGGGSTMLVRWIYVRKDGTLDNSDTPATNTADPLVGRYAFWIDDSSSRLNLNTAFQRANNTNAPCDVSRIDLTTIPAFAAGTVAYDTHAYATNNPFNSDYDLRTNEIYSAASSNRYAYTFYNHSSDGLNPFGKPKIYLTTQIANLPPGFTNMPGYTNYYFDILANDSGNPTNAANDPGVAVNLSDAKINTVVNNLYSYLTNTAWPEYPGMSFANKFWHSNTDPRIFQLAVNILEYVRAKESQQEIVSAVIGNINGTSPNYSFSSSTVANASGATPPQNGMGGSLIGITRTPYLNEMGIYWDTTPYLHFLGEIYLPPNCGIDTLNLGDFVTDRQYISKIISPPGGGEQRWWWQSSSQGGRAQLSAYGSSTFPLNAMNRYGTVTSDTDAQGNFNGTNTTMFYFWLGLAPINAPYALSTCAPYGEYNNVFGTNMGVGPVTLYSTNTTVLPNSFQIDDPLRGIVATNWVWTNSTWGAANAAVVTLGKRPSAPVGSAPYADVNSTGFTTNIGWRMPYPYLFPCTNYDGTVTIKNTTGRMDSLAELGYINTGAVDWSGPTANLDQNGVSYRTLHFQPSKTQTLPDWALIDLFALPPPVTSTNFTYQPYAWTNVANTYNGVGGRLNINGLIYPFTNATTRITPLIALLSGATNPMTGSTLSSTTTGTLATNILFQTTSSGVSLGTISITGQAFDSTNGLYAHIGELAEVAGMADGGEASEANLYEPLAQTTVSGNVFTIYTVGQALQQLPSGSIIVNGEKRYQATVERIPTVPASQTSGLFRNVVVRELTP